MRAFLDYTRFSYVRGDQRCARLRCRGKFSMKLRNCAKEILKINVLIYVLNHKIQYLEIIKPELQSRRTHLFGLNT